MRVAQIVASYHPVRGGVETHVRRIAEGLALAGDQVTVLTHQTGGLAAEEAVGPVQVLRFPLTVNLPNYSLSLPLFGYLRRPRVRLRHRARTQLPHAGRPGGHPHRPAVRVHSALPRHRSHSAARAAAPPLPSGRRSAIRRRGRGHLPHGGRERSRDRHFPRHGGEGAGDPRWHRPTARGRPEFEGYRMCGAGSIAIRRLERYKRVDLVITACRALGTEVTLVVVGDGPDRPRLERLASETGSGGSGGSVRFTGRISDAELGELLTAAAVVTSASEHEAFGLIVADGLAAGRASSPPLSPRTVRSAAWPGPTRRSCTSIRPTRESSPRRWPRHWRWAGRRPGGCGCPPGVTSWGRCASCTGR